MSAAINAFLKELYDAQRESNLADAAVARCEDVRKLVLAEKVATSDAKTATAAEHEARAGDEYRQALNNLHEARLAAAEANAKADYMNKRWEKWRTLEASAREKRRAGSQ